MYTRWETVRQCLQVGWGQAGVAMLDQEGFLGGHSRGESSWRGLVRQKGLKSCKDGRF